jgi:hypothetical protein
MAEPINLDELLSKDEPIETPTEETSETSEETSSADDSTEDQGVDVSNEDNESQSVETSVENTTQEEYSDGYAEETIVQQPDTTQEFEQEYFQPEEQPVAQYQFKDPFIEKAVQYYETYGTLQPFLRATEVDYREMSDLEILKVKFDTENFDLNPKARQKLFDKELEKYGLDAYDEEDKEVGEALLRRDAQKLRHTFMEEQQQFLNNVQSTPQAQQGPSQEELAAQQEASRKIISEGISSVIKDSIIKVGANGEGINYQIQNPNDVVDYAMDSNKFLSIFAKDGSVDWDKWTKTVAFAQNPTQFISELIKHGKSLGRKAMESELKNVVPPTINKTVVQSNNIERPSDDPIAFLQGMTITKK